MNKLQEVCTTLVLRMTCSHLQSPLCHLHPNSMLLAEYTLEGPVTLVQENCMGQKASPCHRNISEFDLLAVKLNFCFCSFVSKQVKNTQSFLLHLPTASMFFLLLDVTPFGGRKNICKKKTHEIPQLYCIPPFPMHLPISECSRYISVCNSPQIARDAKRSSIQSHCGWAVRRSFQCARQS